MHEARPVAAIGCDIVRLGSADRILAARLFAMMADVFDEPAEPLSEAYLLRLLAAETFWALAAVSGPDVIGGITAHALPMTKVEAQELFVYDVAVRADRQRQGVGRALFRRLLDLACEAGIEEVFVPADEADAHALAFYRAIGGSEAPVRFFSFTPGASGDDGGSS